MPVNSQGLFPAPARILTACHVRGAHSGPSAPHASRPKIKKNRTSRPGVPESRTGRRLLLTTASRNKRTRAGSKFTFSSPVLRAECVPTLAALAGYPRACRVCGAVGGGAAWRPAARRRHWRRRVGTASEPRRNRLCHLTLPVGVAPHLEGVQGLA